MKKKCKKCGSPKSLRDFPKVRANRDGHGGKCKDCDNTRRRKQDKKDYWKDPEKRKKKSRDWWNKNRFRGALIHTRVDAKRGGYEPCTATASEVKDAFTGKCAICGVPEIECSGKLHLDHNHETGQFRGFLCARCNRMLGMARDSQDILMEALCYLENSNSVV